MNTAPDLVSSTLNTIFTKLDSLIERNSLLRVKSIGSKLIIVGNMPAPIDQVHIRGKQRFVLVIIIKRGNWWLKWPRKLKLLVNLMESI
jgi:hypothetical protein